MGVDIELKAARKREKGFIVYFQGTW